MYRITIQMVLQLIAKVKGITIESIDHECLLPFGCKLAKVNQRWYIKHYSWDQSDLTNLINRFPFLINKLNNQS